MAFSIRGAMWCATHRDQCSGWQPRTQAVQQYHPVPRGIGYGRGGGRDNSWSGRGQRAWKTFKGEGRSLGRFARQKAGNVYSGARYAYNDAKNLVGDHPRVRNWKENRAVEKRSRAYRDERYANQIKRHHREIQEARASYANKRYDAEHNQERYLDEYCAKFPLDCENRRMEFDAVRRGKRLQVETALFDEQQRYAAAKAAHNREKHIIPQRWADKVPILRNANPTRGQLKDFGAFIVDDVKYAAKIPVTPTPTRTYYKKNSKGKMTKYAAELRPRVYRPTPLREEDRRPYTPRAMKDMDDMDEQFRRNMGF